MDPYKFKALLGNANLNDANEFLGGQEMLDRMVQGVPVTPAAYPTRTPGHDEAAGGGTGTDTGGGTGTGDGGGEEEVETTTPANLEKTVVDLANEILALQNIMGTMTNVDSVSGIKDPDDTEVRLPLTILVNKLMEGDDKSIKKKWDAVHEVYPEEKGVHTTVSQLSDYLLAWVGATNTSYERKSDYYDPETNSVKYWELGENFGNADKVLLSLC